MPSDPPPSSDDWRHPEALTPDELDEHVEEQIDLASRVQGGRLKTEERPPTPKIVIEPVVESIELKEGLPAPPKDPDGADSDEPEAPPVPSVISRAGSGLLGFGWIALAWLPALLAAGLVVLFSVDTPFGKDWERIDLLQKVHQGKATAADFLAVEDGSRAPLPKAAGVLLARVTDGNYRAAVWLNFAVIAAAALGVLFMLGNTFSKGLKLIFGILIANLILFSPHHHQQLLSGSALGPAIALASLVWAILFATAQLPWLLRLIFCLICALIASFSHVAGLAIWPLVLVLIFTIRNREKLKGRIWFGLLWTLFSAAVVGFWLRQPAVPGGPLWAAARDFAAAGDVAAAAKTWFAVVAESLAPVWLAGKPNQLIILVGLALFCGFVSLIVFWIAATTMRGRTDLWNRCLPWLGLGFGSLIGTLAVSLTSPQPFEATTAMLASPVLLSIVVLVVVFRGDGNDRAPAAFLSRNSKIVWAALFGAILAHQSALWMSGIRAMADDQTARLQSHATLLLSPVFDPPGLNEEEAAQFQKRADFLQSAGYRKLFANARLDHLEIRKPTAGIPAPSAQSSEISGSATLPNSRRPAHAVVAARTGGTPVIFGVAEMEGSAWKMNYEGSEPADIWIIDIRNLRAWRTPFRLVFNAQGAIQISKREN